MNILVCWLSLFYFMSITNTMIESLGSLQLTPVGMFFLYLEGGCGQIDIVACHNHSYQTY